MDFVLARILVRLIEDGETGEALARDCVAGDSNGGGDFLRVVGVIGVNTWGDTLKAAADAREVVQSFDNFLVAEVEGGMFRKGSRFLLGKKHFGDGGSGQRGIETANGAGESEIVGGKDKIFGVKDELALRAELVEGGGVICLRFVNIGMVVRNGGDDGKPRVKFKEIAIIFVGLVDEELIALVVSTRGGETKRRADDVGSGNF